MAKTTDRPPRKQKPRPIVLQKRSPTGNPHWHELPGNPSFSSTAKAKNSVATAPGVYQVVAITEPPFEVKEKVQKTFEFATPIPDPAPQPDAGEDGSDE